MRVYITGIEGMLGSAIAYLHQRKGDEVFGCDIWKTPSVHSRIDIRNMAQLTDDIAVAKPDRVYHCAAMLGVQNTENYPDVCRQINEFGTENVVKAARMSGASEFVFLSSSEVYGNGYDFKPFSETSPLVGDNVYANGKKRGEAIVLAQSRTMKIVVTRMFNCFGVGQVKQFFIPKAMDLCLRGKKVPIYGSFDNKRSYLLGHDAAQHIINVANNAANEEIVNIAHPTAHTLGDVYNMIVEVCGKSGGASLRIEAYDDRNISRDVPNRLAVIDKLLAFSNHVPTELPASISFLKQVAHTLRDDWDYERAVV